MKSSSFDESSVLLADGSRALEGPAPRCASIGTLAFELGHGRNAWHIGRGLPEARIRVRDRRALWKILVDPEMNLGSTWVDGAWQPVDCRLGDVLDIAVRIADADEVRTSAFVRTTRRLLNWLGELNTPWRSRRNVHRHYDLDLALYQSFLDRDLHYSCAYFGEGVCDLDTAQRAKCEHIAAKLDLAPGARVLDIGCGWGSLALHLAAHHGVEVTGITLSKEQRDVATERAARCGLAKRVEFRLEDYRETSGEFDAIVSVGMFEHVGRPQYRRFFERIHRLLRPDGTALIHSIGRAGPPGTTSRWIRRHIFPGGYIPAASEMVAAMEPSGLILADLEVLRLHYARTLAEWHRRFQAHRAAIADRFGERFCRMWEFYLLGSEASFRYGGLVVFQLQLARDLLRLPLTRRYLITA